MLKQASPTARTFSCRSIAGGTAEGRAFLLRQINLDAAHVLP
jgi:hypothetical protein